MLSNIENCILEFDQGGKKMFAGSGYPEYTVLKIDGLTALEFDVQTVSNPQIEGVAVTNMKAREREIEILIHCTNIVRDGLISYFNPYKKGKLTITWNGITRWINYICQPINIDQRKVYLDLNITITLLCVEPYFNDMDDYGKDIAAVQPLFAFPFVLLADRGCITDYRLENNQVKIQNKGHVSTPVRVAFTAKGEVVNPKLVLNNKEFLKCGRTNKPMTMKSGDIIIYNTDKRNIIQTLNGENVSNYTDPLSTFFQIPAGENIIEFGADSGISNMKVNVFFTPKYLGV